MIITRKIKLNVTEQNFSYYENLGYDPVIGEELVIPIELLSSGSHFKIKCKCDKCGDTREIIYKNYLKYNNKWGFYTCRKCSEHKRKKSLKRSYNVEYPMQNEKLKKRILKKRVQNKYKN